MPYPSLDSPQIALKCKSQSATQSETRASLMRASGLLAATSTTPSGTVYARMQVAMSIIGHTQHVPMALE